MEDVSIFFYTPLLMPAILEPLLLVLKLSMSIVRNVKEKLRRYQDTGHI